MPRSSSSSSSRPILGRAMAILALPLTPISKARGPIARNLLIFKKRGAAGKARRMLSSSSSSYGYKPHRHYNYAYVGEYQFSPSSSPLIAYPPGVSSWRRAAKKRRSKARMILASLLCGGGDLDVAVLDGLPRADEPRAAVEWEECGRDGGAYGEEEYGDDDNDEEEEEEEGVDGRAERFIERFYEEMRLQRQRSLVQRLL
ncbi:uncharacterized protein LOC102719523 [Oryza brachyantha]|uniref:Uncharacterized protein n=1 Tax=Oryza brachyantha TaxID=4533 RepID=J3KW52_ORYBR|nr:uncharacterized protein LOC102719523 [Oryza brachyantha]